MPNRWGCNAAQFACLPQDIGATWEDFAKPDQENHWTGKPDAFLLDVFLSQVTLPEGISSSFHLLFGKLDDLCVSQSGFSGCWKGSMSTSFVLWVFTFVSNCVVHLSPLVPRWRSGTKQPRVWANHQTRSNFWWERLGDSSGNRWGVNLGATWSRGILVPFPVSHTSEPDRTTWIVPVILQVQI